VVVALVVVLTVLMASWPVLVLLVVLVSPPMEAV
jgi:hypothetical protein